MFHLSRVSIKWFGHLAFTGNPDFKPGVNILVGKNGSGKTSILKTIYNRENISVIEDEITSIPETEPLVKFQFKEVNNEGNEDITSVQFSRNSNWENKDYLQKKIRFITSERSVKNQFTTANPYKQISNFDLQDPNQEINVADEFNKAIIFELHKEIQRLKGEAGSITEGLEGEYQKGLVDFEKSIRIDFERDTPVYFVDFRGKEVDIGSLSSGEKEYLYFYAFLRRIREDENKIILIDEPELHLHGSQIRKLCEIIADISLKNQVIIATHSGDVLQHFINSANIVLLERGRLSNVVLTEDFTKVIDQLGLPIDPSFFTAHWICAENKVDGRLGGPEAPKTEDVLQWIFDKNVVRRYWTFGSNKLFAEGAIEMLNNAAQSNPDIKLTTILDGDKLSNLSTFPPELPAVDGLEYFPFWEIENIFLKAEILDEVINEEEGKNGSTLAWEIFEKNEDLLFESHLKTLTKNSVRKLWRDNYFSGNLEESLTKWKEKVSVLKIDREEKAVKFHSLIESRNWEWIPGKEALNLIYGLDQDFWKKIKVLVESGRFTEILATDTNIQSLKERILSTEGIEMV